MVLLAMQVLIVVRSLTDHLGDQPAFPATGTASGST
jgi:hypothetical protein